MNSQSGEGVHAVLLLPASCSTPPAIVRVYADGGIDVWTLGRPRCAPLPGVCQAHGMTPAEYADALVGGGLRLVGGDDAA